MVAPASSSSDINQTLSPIISFIQSQKGKPLLIANEHIFKLNKTTTITKYRKCTLNRCSAKIHKTLNGQLIKMIGDRSHLLEIEKLEKAEQPAINETKRIPRIYDE